MIKSKSPRVVNTTTKFTEEQNEKLVALAEKNGIAKSNLIYQLVAEGFKSVTKTKKEF